jgi:hypothetical protein
VSVKEIQSIKNTIFIFVSYRKSIRKRDREAEMWRNPFVRLSVFICLDLALFSGCAGVRPAPRVDTIPRTPEEVPETQMQLLGCYQPTFYCLVDEADERYAGLPAKVPVRDIYGQLIAMVSEEFKRKADVEGSARLLDGRVINFAGRAPAGVR